MVNEYKLPYGRLKRLKTSPNIYWEYYDRELGRNNQRSLGTSDMNQAYRLAKKLATEHLAERDGLIQKTNHHTVTLGHAALARYEDMLSSGLDPEHCKISKLHMDGKILEFFGASLPLNKITVADIKDFRTWLQFERDLQPVSVNKVLVVLSTIFNTALENEWIDTKPYISKLSVQKKKVGYFLTDEEIQCLLTVARDYNHYVLRWIALGLYSGLRHAEACRAQWENIDWSQGLLYFEKQKNKTSLPAPLGKAREILEEVPMAEHKGHIVMFKGRPVKKLRDTWHTVRKAAGLPEGVIYHDLRKTFVSRAYKKFGFEAQYFSRHTDKDAFFLYMEERGSQLLNRAGEIFK